MPVLRTKTSRMWLPDALRGLALLNMLAYHAMYDWVYVFGHESSWYNIWTPGCHVWQQYICWSFILLSGFSFPLAKRPAKNGLIVAGCAAVLTFVTAVFMPSEAIWFGVLHLNAAAVLLTADAPSEIYDHLFARRFACAEGFAALGADARSEGRLLYLGGSAKLHGATVTAPDLRGGAALVLAGLGVGDGSCVRVLDAGHIRRGYADLAGDLRRLGADCRAGRTGTEAGRQTKKL